MKSKIALDTNILVYLYDINDATKRPISESLLAYNPSLSVQTISEFLNVTKRLHKITKAQLMSKCIRMLKYCEIEQLDRKTMLDAEYLIDRYDFQLFDSIIIASALQANCDILYSEDLQHKQVIEKRLTILNPFL